MSAIAYVDSSALLKLVVEEPETSRLEAHLAERDGFVVSRLAIVECRRAVQRVANKRVLQVLEQVLQAIYLVEITPAISEQASQLSPPVLRSLDAIHIATALAIGDPHVDVITYDQRMTDGARANGLRVVRP
jgi:predicted nucleic acid-binding protein